MITILAQSKQRGFVYLIKEEVKGTFKRLFEDL